MLISSNSGLHSARVGKLRYSMVDEAVDFLADAGFEAFDVNFCGVIKREANAREPILDKPGEVERLAERLAERGLAVHTGHLPFFDYVNKDNPDYDYIQGMVYRSVDASGLLGVDYTVVHTARLAADTVEYARPICEYANRLGVGIAIENSPHSTIDNLCEAVDTLAKEGYKVGCCFDSGHANYAGLGQAEVLTQIGDRLKMLHIHDNYGDRDAHQAPFAGSIDWRQTMTALARIGYTGDFNYEISALRLPESCRAAYAKYLIELAHSLIAIYDDELKIMKNEVI